MLRFKVSTECDLNDALKSAQKNHDDMDVNSLHDTEEYEFLFDIEIHDPNTYQIIHDFANDNDLYVMVEYLVASSEFSFRVSKHNRWGIV